MPIQPLYYPQIKQTNFANLQEFAPVDVKILDAFMLDITQKDVDFLNTFNPDKLLYNFRVTAGLPNTKATSSYSGWENTRIGGHTLGHYLAAVGQALARGYGECKGSDGVTLQARFDYIIEGLEECQKALGSGFIFGATMEDPARPERQFDRLEEGNPADTWVPWYTVHKIMTSTSCTNVHVPADMMKQPANTFWTLPTSLMKFLFLKKFARPALTPMF